MPAWRRLAAAALSWPALALAGAPDAPDACPAGTSWEAFVSMSVESDLPVGRVDFQRYADGVMVRIGEGGKSRQLLELDDGWRLVKGASHPLAFTGVAMGIMIPAALLQYTLAAPCDTGSRESFAFDVAAGNRFGMQPAHVSGTVRRDGNAIAYDIRIEDAKGRGARSMRGVWVGGAPLQPAPEDMELAGWDVFHGVQPWPAQAEAPAGTLRQLRASGPAR